MDGEVNCEEVVQIRKSVRRMKSVLKELEGQNTEGKAEQEEIHRQGKKWKYTKYNRKKKS